MHVSNCTACVTLLVATTIGAASLGTAHKTMNYRDKEGRVYGEGTRWFILQQETRWTNQTVPITQAQFDVHKPRESTKQRNRVFLRQYLQACELRECIEDPRWQSRQAVVGDVQRLYLRE